MPEQTIPLRLEAMINNAGDDKPILEEILNRFSQKLKKACARQGIGEDFPVDDLGVEFNKSTRQFTFPNGKKYAFICIKDGKARVLRLVRIPIRDAAVLKP